jgi:hypothetical protein
METVQVMPCGVVYHANFHHAIRRGSIKICGLLVIHLNVAQLLLQSNFLTLLKARPGPLTTLAS